MTLEVRVWPLGGGWRLECRSVDGFRHYFLVCPAGWPWGLTPRPDYERRLHFPGVN